MTLADRVREALAKYGPRGEPGRLCVDSAGRRGVGIELKASYYRQAVKNVEAALSSRALQLELLDYARKEAIS